MLDPYARAGLVRNPFAWVDGGDAGPFLDHLGLAVPKPSEGRLRQLIGDAGAGKTSHLRAWLESAGGDYFYVEPDAPCDPPLGPLVYWDEADRLPDRRLRPLLRRARTMGATVVAGTHRDLSRAARRAGIPTETIILGPVDFDLLRTWVDTRIEAARGRRDRSVALDDNEFDHLHGNQPSVEISDGILIELLDQPGLTLRSAGDELHRLVARQVRNP